MQQRRTCSAARAAPSQAMAAVRPSGLILGATVTSCTAGASRSRGTRPRSPTQSSSIVMTASLTCGHVIHDAGPFDDGKSSCKSADLVMVGML